MKTVLRLLNLVIMALSAVATILLFTTPTFSFNSNIGINVSALNNLIPENEYTGPIDIAHVLGSKEIHLSVKFNFGFDDVNQTMGGGNKAKIDELVLDKNVEGLFADLYEPVDIITEYTVRTVLNKIIKDQMTQQIENALSEAAIESGSTAQDIMDELGMTDAYFKGFAKLLYDSASVKTDEDPEPTVNGFTDVLFGQVQQVIDEANAALDGQIDETKFGPAQKDEIKAGFVDIFTTLKLVKEDGPTPDDHYLVPFNKLVYVYLNDYLKTELQSRVSDPTVLDPMSGEKIEDYSRRLVLLYVKTMMPEAFYNVVGYVSLGLFIGVIAFAFIYGLLFLITLLKTFTSKPWTIFGPWFWIIGSLQLVLGVGLTIFGKFIVPNIKIPVSGLPVGRVILAPRTFALIPSLIFIGFVALGIVYAIIRSIAKSESEHRTPKPKKIVVQVGGNK